MNQINDNLNLNGNENEQEQLQQPPPQQPPPLSVPEERIMRVQMKVPPFWKECPELWFAKLESQFITTGVTTDATKYHTVVAALDNIYAMAISDIIRTPPATNKYTAIKQRLISVYADSQQKKLKKMLRELSLGDNKPSQLLRQMIDLASNQITADGIKTIWLERLGETHPSVASVLAIVAGPLDTLAEQADKMTDLASNTATIATTSVQPNLQLQIEALTQAINSFGRSRTDKRNRGRSHSRDQSRNNRDSRSKSQPKYDTCWYHHKFGHKAKKCSNDGTCKFQKPEN